MKYIGYAIAAILLVILIATRQPTSVSMEEYNEMISKYESKIESLNEIISRYEDDIPYDMEVIASAVYDLHDYFHEREYMDKSDAVDAADYLYDLFY